MLDREVQHSPEPWRWHPSLSRGGEPTNQGGEDRGGFLDANGSVVCWFGNNESYYPTAGDDPGNADAERIVACVNACAGIPTEDLLRCTGDNPTLKVVGVERVTLKPVGAVPLSENPAVGVDMAKGPDFTRRVVMRSNRMGKTLSQAMEIAELNDPSSPQFKLAFLAAIEQDAVFRTTMRELMMQTTSAVSYASYAPLTGNHLDQPIPLDWNGKELHCVSTADGTPLSLMLWKAQDRWGVDFQADQAVVSLRLETLRDLFALCRMCNVPFPESPTCMKADCEVPMNEAPAWLATKVVQPVADVESRFGVNLSDLEKWPSAPSVPAADIGPVHVDWSPASPAWTEAASVASPGHPFPELPT